jgi:hypothetical protein
MTTESQSIERLQSVERLMSAAQAANPGDQGANPGWRKADVFGFLFVLIFGVELPSLIGSVLYLRRVICPTSMGGGALTGAAGWLILAVAVYLGMRGALALHIWPGRDAATAGETTCTHWVLRHKNLLLQAPVYGVAFSIVLALPWALSPSCDGTGPAMRQAELAGAARPIAAYDIAAMRTGCCTTEPRPD